MYKIEKYTGEKTYMFPNGALATRERVLEKFPAALTFAHVVQTDENGEVMWAFQNLSAMRSMHGIDKALPEADAIAALEALLNAPKETVAVASPEERIAAALEFQNLMSMVDAE